ncbi:MAG: ATP-dependent metallopeptidase FtsH/Yme1/Tma family protein, partial [Bacteroidota bacterium]
MADNNQFPNTDRNKSPRPNNNIYWIYAVILAFFLLGTFLFNPSNPESQISEPQLKEYVRKGYVSEIQVINAVEFEITLNEKGRDRVSNPKGNSFGERGPHLLLKASSPYNGAEVQKSINDILEEKLQAAEADGNLKNFEESGMVRITTDTRANIGDILQILIPIGILVALWFFFMRRVGGAGPGGQIFNIGKSKASLYDKENKVNVTFDDVAGLEEAKEEVQEVVEFLKNPQKFTKLGGHIVRSSKICTGPSPIRGALWYYLNLRMASIGDYPQSHCSPLCRSIGPMAKSRMLITWSGLSSISKTANQLPYFVLLTSKMSRTSSI